ncbi:MAG: NAD/NADP octopine/nopaline dehydrogenase family protein [Chloroflexota bacterium]|nr:NAD/NADP octopine/nopaline dehydrogenase family protein [Chloroflexota bacterium]
MAEMIAVLGAGNGGCAIAAHLALQGHKVNLYEIPELKESFRPLQEKKEIVIRGKAEDGVARLNTATTDIKEAVSGVETIIVTIPAFGYQHIAQLLAPVLVDGQLVAFIPGAFATIYCLEEMHKREIETEVTFAESVTLPYAARLTSRNEVSIAGTAILLPVGVFPARKAEPVLKKLKEYYPVITGSRDILDVALNNLNPVTHPAPVILSTSVIENSNDFYLYRDGITGGVKKVMLAMDKERIAVRKACGIDTPHYGYHQLEPFEVFEDYFGKGSLMETGYKLKGPSSITDRYVTDDVPYGLVLYSTIGKKVGVETPVCDAIINLASVINGESYWESSANIEKMFISHWSIDKLTRFLFEGE